jgi:hypothetical protein
LLEKKCQNCPAIKSTPFRCQPKLASLI